MKSVHSDAPPDSRPWPEVCVKLEGNGHAVEEGSGSAGSGVEAAAGTSLGMPEGTWAAATPGPSHRHAPKATAITSACHGFRTRSLPTSCTRHQETVF